MNTYYPLATNEANTGLARSVLCAISFNYCEVAEKAEAVLVMTYLMAEQQRMWATHVSRRFKGSVEVAARPKSKYRLGIDDYLLQEHHETQWKERLARDIVEEPRVKVYAPEDDHSTGNLSAESYKRTATASEKRIVEPSAPDKPVDMRLIRLYREDFGMSYKEWRSLVMTHGSVEALSMIPRESVGHLTGMSSEELDDIFGTDATQKTAISHFFNRK